MAYCAKCEELKERIRELERDLEQALSQDEQVYIREYFGLTYNETDVLVQLYKAKGRAVQNWTLLDNLPARRTSDYRNSSNVIRVIVHSIRNRMSQDSIETAWGYGYRLGKPGLERIQAAIARRKP
jgi:DNA-binding response OmpR family regulator